jgi:hypothetical protein
MEKLPFVYLWENLENGMKYIGSHYGTYDDDYVSSSNYFNEHYNQNPLIFKRKILSVHNTRLDALIEEEKLLDEVDAANNKQYYNLINTCGRGWSHHENEELARIYYNRISKAKKGVPSKNKGVPMKEEQKLKLSDLWIVTGPEIDGYIIVENMSKFCGEKKLNPSAMSAVARGKSRSHLGYWCRKLINKRNVFYEPKKWESRGKVGGSKSFGAKNGFSKKVKIDGVVYDCIREATEKTGLSYHLIRKIGDFNV